MQAFLCHFPTLRLHWFPKAYGIKPKLFLFHAGNLLGSSFWTNSVRDGGGSVVGTIRRLKRGLSLSHEHLWGWHGSNCPSCPRALSVCTPVYLTPVLDTHWPQGSGVTVGGAASFWRGQFSEQDSVVLVVGEISTSILKANLAVPRSIHKRESANEGKTGDFTKTLRILIGVFHMGEGEGLNLLAWNKGS